MARLSPFSVLGLVRELREAAAGDAALIVAGAPALAEALRRELSAGAATGSVREHGLAGAAAVAYVLAGPPDEQDRAALKDAHRRRLPIVAVLAHPTMPDDVPYVLATDIVRVPAGAGFPIEAVADVLARRLGEEGTALAARVPAVRRAVCDALIARFARRNAIVGVAVFVPGADLPILTLNQLRLVLRIGLAHGVQIDAQRLPEILAVVGSGLGFRAVARRALGYVPLAGWAVKGAVAYTGTRAVGELAVRYFESRVADAA